MGSVARGYLWITFACLREFQKPCVEQSCSLFLKRGRSRLRFSYHQSVSWGTKLAARVFRALGFFGGFSNGGFYTGRPYLVFSFDICLRTFEVCLYCFFTPFIPLQTSFYTPAGAEIEMLSTILLLFCACVCFSLILGPVVWQQISCHLTIRFLLQRELGWLSWFTSDEITFYSATTALRCYFFVV